MLGIETLDDTQPEQRLIDGRKDLGVLFLPLGGRFLETATDTTDKEDGDRHEDEYKERELPRDDEERDEVHEDHDGVLEEDIECRHDGCLDLVDIVGHTRDDVSAAGVGEVPHREGEDLIVELLSEVPQYTGADGHHVVVREPRGGTLESGHDDEEETQDEQHITGPVQGDLVIEEIVEVGPQGGEGVLESADGVELGPLDVHGGQTEEDPQHGDDGGEGEQGQDRREEVEQDVQTHLHLIRRHETFYEFQERHT